MPLLGHGYMLAPTPLEKLAECRERFGQVFRLDKGEVPTVWLCDYEEIIRAMKLDVLQYRPQHLLSGMAGIWYVSPSTSFSRAKCCWFSSGIS